MTHASPAPGIATKPPPEIAFHEAGNAIAVEAGRFRGRKPATPSADTMRAALVSAAAVVCAPVAALTLIEEWSTSQKPAPPQLKPVMIGNASEIALPVMDFTR